MDHSLVYGTSAIQIECGLHAWCTDDSGGLPPLSGVRDGRGCHELQAPRPELGGDDMWQWGMVKSPLQTERMWVEPAVNT